MDVTAPMGQCPWPGTRTCKYTFPVWTSDNFERLEHSGLGGMSLPKPSSHSQESMQKRQ